MKMKLLYFFLILIITRDVQCNSNNSRKSSLLYYDFIIVGSGVSGSILAEKLSAKGFNILILEAGDPSIADIDGKDFVGTKGSINPKTNIYKAERAITKSEVPLYWVSNSLNGPKWDIQGANVAKMIGGCGVHNGMVFQRGVKDDYNWNITGWNYNDIKDYFKEIESIKEDHLNSSPHHGTKGPIEVRSIPMDYEGEEFLKSCNSSGIEFNNDFNQEEYRGGCGYIQFNIKTNGERSSTAVEYLVKAVRRPNVDIIYNAHVTKVKWEWNQYKNRYDAKSIEYIKIVDDEYNNQKPITVSFRREVILAGGSLNSPKILLNSGVGDFNYLSKFSKFIKPIKNLQGVGKNLQNHVMIFTLFNNSNCMKDVEKPNLYNLYKLDLEYSTKGTGIFSSPGYSVGAFLKANTSIPGNVDTMVAVFPGSIAGQFSHPTITFAISISYPTNTHSMELSNITKDDCQNSFLLKPPVLNLKSIHSDEVKSLVNGIKETKRILSYPPLVNHVTPFIPDPMTYQSERDLQEYVERNSINHDHWSSTCKLGDLKSDPMSVVDKDLKVHGLGNIRVLDASILPKIPNSLLQATVMVVASKGADIILKEHYNIKSKSIFSVDFGIQI